GIAPARVAVVGGGLNFEAIPAPAPLQAPRVLFIGRDFERKGGDTLVAAFRLARERVPEAELWMVTGRADISGPGIRRIAPTYERAAIAALYRIASTYDRAAIAALYRASSIYAMPSRLETWGDVFLEAMAYGLPCIGSANDAMPEIIEH